jgi:hypothetical protein
MNPFTTHGISATSAHRDSSRHVLSFSLGLVSLALVATTGCSKKAVPDPTLAANVKSALTADSSISQQPVQVAVQSGVVTLTGNVSDDTASSVAAQDAAKVSGVKEVVNDLTVAGISVPPTVTSPATPTYARPATAQEQTAIAQNQPLPAPPENAPAPPEPVFHDITVPAGKEISIRLTEELDSATTQTGTPIHGVVTHQVVSDGYVVIPAGAAVSGTVIDAKDAGHYKGNSILSIEFTSLRRRGNLIAISTDPYTVEGKGRGKNSVEKIGGGAAIGAVLGGIFGGGKGAAIGAAAGGGGGAVVQGVTHGQQVTIQSESVIRFHLANPITVHTAEAAGEEAPSQGLQTR